MSEHNGLCLLFKLITDSCCNSPSLVVFMDVKSVKITCPVYISKAPKSDSWYLLISIS